MIRKLNTMLAAVVAIALLFVPSTVSTAPAEGAQPDPRDWTNDPACEDAVHAANALLAVKHGYAPMDVENALRIIHDGCGGFGRVGSFVGLPAIPAVSGYREVFVDKMEYMDTNPSNYPTFWTWVDNLRDWIDKLDESVATCPGGRALCGTAMYLGACGEDLDMSEDEIVARLYAWHVFVEGL